MSFSNQVRWNTAAFYGSTLPLSTRTVCSLSKQEQQYIEATIFSAKRAAHSISKGNPHSINCLFMSRFVAKTLKQARENGQEMRLSSELEDGIIAASVAEAREFIKENPKPVSGWQRLRRFSSGLYAIFLGLLSADSFGYGGVAGMMSSPKAKEIIVRHMEKTLDIESAIFRELQALLPKEFRPAVPDPIDTAGRFINFLADVTSTPAGAVLAPATLFLLGAASFLGARYFYLQNLAVNYSKFALHMRGFILEKAEEAKSRGQ